MVNGTLIWYYMICKREVWLIAHQINPDQDNSNIDLGRYIHQFYYQRNKKEIIIGNCKFDLVKKKNGNLIVGEIKKSSKFLTSAKYQLLFYLKQIQEENGMKVSGEILIPEEKKRISIELTEEHKKELEQIEKEIETIIEQAFPPKKEKIKYCYKCAYNEFCWA